MPALAGSGQPGSERVTSSSKSGRWLGAGVVLGLLLAGLAWFIWASAPHPDDSEIEAVYYGEGAHEYLELVAGMTTGNASRRTGGSFEECDLPNGGEGERRDLGASAMLGAGQSGGDVLAEVERLWRTDSLGTGVVVSDVESTGDQVSAMIDGLAAQATVASDELVLNAASICLPLNTLEPFRG